MIQFIIANFICNISLYSFFFYIQFIFFSFPIAINITAHFLPLPLFLVRLLSVLIRLVDWTSRHTTHPRHSCRRLWIPPHCTHTVTIIIIITMIIGIFIEKIITMITVIAMIRPLLAMVKDVRTIEGKNLFLWEDYESSIWW